MKIFDSGDIQGLLSYAPDALALPLNAALALADRTLRGVVSLPSLQLAIVVFSSVDRSGVGPVSNYHRDLLWKAFGLPVFEQLRGWDGRVMARECEVHDGLHFDASFVRAELDRGELLVTGIATGIAAEIVIGQCDGGLETPRIRPRDAVRRRAAAA